MTPEVGPLAGAIEVATGEKISEIQHHLYYFDHPQLLKQHYYHYRQPCLLVSTTPDIKSSSCLSCIAVIQKISKKKIKNN